MTEIPEHLLRRAESARTRAATFEDTAGFNGPGACVNPGPAYLPPMVEDAPPLIAANVTVTITIKGVRHDLTMEEARALKDALIPLVGVKAPPPGLVTRGRNPLACACPGGGHKQTCSMRD